MKDKKGPFGVTNSGASFQRLMGHILRGLEYRLALIYIDDIVIFSKSIEEHLTHLEEVFRRLRDANVKLNPEKCSFVKQRIVYLGHVVTTEGIFPDPSKVEVVKNFPTPASLKELKSFLGLANYYQRFIKGFSEIASPLNAITKKGVKFFWSESCANTFDRLKRALISAPVLTFPDFDEQFLLYVDASSTGIGFALAQVQDGKEVVIAFNARGLNQAERNYTTTEREALALVEGCQNGNADALSRRPYPTTNLNALQQSDPEIEKICEKQRKDPELSEIMDYIQHDSLPSNDAKARRILLRRDCFYISQDGLLYHLDRSQKRSARDSFSQLSKNQAMSIHNFDLDSDGVPELITGWSNGKKVNTSSYHPQTDGLVERFNSTLCQSLSMYVAKNQRDWDDFIPLILFAHRTSISEAIGDSPFYCLYGREPRLPLDVELLPPAADDLSTSVLDHRKRIVEKVELAQNLARENIQRSQQKMKEYYDRNASQPLFEIGQSVWVYTPKTKKGLSKKLLYNWFGPYRIVEQSSPVHYRLRSKSNKKVTFAVHANRMKPFVDPALRPIKPRSNDDPSEPHLDESDIPADSFESSESHNHNSDTSVTVENNTRAQTNSQGQPDAPDQRKDDNQFAIDNQTIFAAEKILKHRKRKGKVQYKVKWLNYPMSQSTWEPEENILDRRLIESFERRDERGANR
ncbi:PREDICTED: uncharacterized protein LOC107341253 [Acropora digitifera]|uniref:uncharacterized protein LOC107341253 n=1 Tax=Acropora digitifera TaxID=70779 RepID=UPI00077AFD4F|nr:PREDICTED: uncharacterized protein LOC107341253 [Acropora digitifera]